MTPNALALLAHKAMRLETGWHPCLDCPTMIGNSRAAVLCSFCLRTRRMARGLTPDGAAKGGGW